MATIFMPLLGGATDVWRPVKVTPLAGAVYRVEGPMPSEENWQFSPGSLVRLEWQKFSDGEERLIPVEDVNSSRSSAQTYFKFNYGIIVGILPYILIIYTIPREYNGRDEPNLFFIACAIWMLIASIALLLLKPRSAISKYAMWSTIGFGGAFCLSELIAGI